LIVVEMVVERLDDEGSITVASGIPTTINKTLDLYSGNAQVTGFLLHQESWHCLHSLVCLLLIVLLARNNCKWDWQERRHKLRRRCCTMQRLARSRRC
jgi:hypothetical protein